MVVELHRSRALTIALGGLHLGGALIAWLLPLPWPVQLALCALVAASLSAALSRHAWRSGPRAITGIEIDSEGQCAVRMAGAWRACTFTHVFVHPRLTLLGLRRHGRRRPEGLVIAADAMEAEAFRRLRAALNLRSWAA